VSLWTFGSSFMRPEKAGAVGVFVDVSVMAASAAPGWRACRPRPPTRSSAPLAAYCQRINDSGH
jgi:hypothetical protein